MPTTNHPWTYESDYQKRIRQKRERAAERHPLPAAEEIGRRFIKSTLTGFALARPDFWQSKLERWFDYRSTFLASLRLVQHLESYPQVIKACTSAALPRLKHGKITFHPPAQSQPNKGPRVAFVLGETAEWIDALKELRIVAGLSDELPDEDLPEDRVSSSGWAKELSAPVADGPISLPNKINKAGCDALARRIEQTAIERSSAGLLKGTAPLVLIRTNSRLESLPVFGPHDHDHLEELLQKTRPLGMKLRWRFDRGLAPWILAAYPEKGRTWPALVEIIKRQRSEIPSRTKYGLSVEGAALFDWLMSLSDSELDHGLAPEITGELLEDEIGIRVPWEDNWMLFFRLLSEEISERTPLRVECHEWYPNSFAESVPRLRIASRP